MRYRWTTAQRPANPMEGMSGYNSTDGVVEWYDGTRWVQADTVVRIQVKNTSGGTLTKGTPIYATGSVGASGEVEVAACRADTAAKMPALGLLEEDLANNAEGEAITTGTLFGVNTSAYSINAPVYVAPTGGLTPTRPTATTDLVQNVGRVMRVHATTGTILVMSPGRTNDVPNLIGTQYLGSGTADSTTFLRGDQTWATPTAGAAGSNTQVQYNSSGALAGDSGLTYNASTDTLSTKVLALGSAGATLGQVTLAGNTSGVVTVQPAAAAGTYTLTLPTTDGNASEFLQTDGSGVLSWAAVTSDPWTKVVLGSDFTTSQSSVQDVGLSFTPAANKKYLVELVLLVQTSNATNGVMPGIAWPSSMTDGAGYITQVGATVGAAVQTWFTNGTNSTTASTTLPGANASYMAQGRFLMVTGASVSGDFKVQVKSENNGTNVSVMTGSCLLYREL